MKIRKRDGSVHEVSDAYILRDGEACVVTLTDDGLAGFAEPHIVAENCPLRHAACPVGS